jgi:UDP-N-acetylglucosamine:LPS N-acetylglucosamine transferase
MREKVIIICAGEGGHFAQALRLIDNINANLFGKEVKLIFITDENNLNAEQLDRRGVYMHYVVGSPRKKSGAILINSLLYAFRVVTTVVALCVKYRPFILSLGPGVAIGPSLIVKFFGGRVVHIETWSRFYSRSGTGKIMSIVADKFYIQNIELSKIYKNSIFSGRL